MKTGYTIENNCCAYKDFFKCIKVFNYESLNMVVNTVSGTLEASNINMIGIWKIKNLK